MIKRIIYKDKNLFIKKGILKHIVSAECRIDDDYPNVYVRYFAGNKIEDWYISCSTKAKAKRIFKILEQK